jgi:shikimate kinase
MPQQTAISIFLTGFMGAGKTTVGQLLADILKLPFVDLDARIVLREQRSIADIFSVEGESYFRDCETALLEQLKEEPTAVYATGGGIVVREANRNAMTDMGCVVYLHTSWTTLQNRLQHSVGRPLVDHDKEWDELKSLWDKRQEFYSKADIIVQTDGLTPPEVARNIAGQLLVKE